MTSVQIVEHSIKRESLPTHFVFVVRCLGTKSSSRATQNCSLSLFFSFLSQSVLEKLCHDHAYCDYEPR